VAIAKRKLTKWRKEALKDQNHANKRVHIDPTMILVINWTDRILLMTQELLDQHLLKEVNKDAP
jgi:hypothetical protein